MMMNRCAPTSTENTAGTALNIERAAVERAEEGGLVLTATGRLARRIIHKYRQRRLGSGSSGWSAPAVFALRRFVMDKHASLWDGTRPLNRAAALRLWAAASKEVPPPEGAAATPALFSMLMEALDVSESNGIDVSNGEPSEKLPAWRAEVSRRFLKMARNEGFVTYRGVAERVALALRQGEMTVARPAVLVGHERLAPVDEIVAGALAEAPGGLTRMSPCIKGGGGSLGARLWATPEQECRAVLAEILDVWNGGHRDLGLVYLDDSYRPMLSGLLAELAGSEAVDLQRAIRYNLAGGDPLTSHPLFETAVMPLRAVAEESGTSLLESYFASVYTREDEEGSAGRLRSSLCGGHPARDCAGGVKALKREGFEVRGIERMLALKRAPLSMWLEALSASWRENGFPKFGGSDRQRDAIAWQHLGEAASSLAAEAGKMEMAAAEAMAWLREAAGGYAVALKTPETAGLQVMPAREALGLSFDRLWVVGAHGEALPRRAADYPLLSGAERRQVEECTQEGRWGEAGRTIEALLACSPAVSFSRSAGKSEDEPFMASPFAPDETDGGHKKQNTLDLWRSAPPAWLRAGWLRAALSSELCPSQEAQEKAPPLDAARCWSVTSIERLAACPFSFFAGCIAGLEPLARPFEGLDPMERGSFVHAVLRRFMQAMKEEKPVSWPEDSGDAFALLAKSVDIQLERDGHRGDVLWQVERERLLGDGSSSGLLGEWLEQERQRAADGWSVLAVEAEFSSLKAAGLMLRGRVDRVDAGPHGKMAVWDYKTGKAPKAGELLEDGAAVQLPAYLLALKRGLVAEVDYGGGPLRGGYIQLRSAAEVSVAPLAEGKGKNKSFVDWEARLTEWEAALEKRLEAPLRGHFPAEPRPASKREWKKKQGACEFCPYGGICGYFGAQAAEPAGEDMDEEEE